MNLLPPQRLKNFACDYKYVAPIFNPALFLPRETLLNKISRQNLKHKKFVFIQAQAGQGKTIFTSQILSHMQLPFIWYRVTKEDTDPVFFLLALLAGIKKIFSDFHSPIIEQMTSSGEVLNEKLSYLAQTLAEDITAKINNPFCIVVDDLHLLENNPIALQSLVDVIENTPLGVKFIFVSRHAVPLPLRDNDPVSSGIMVENDSLQFSRTEISRLFNEYLHIPIAKKEINSLAEISQGWLAALLLLGEQMRHQKLVKTSKLANLEEIYIFFEQETFSAFDDQLLINLSKLALLDEIPLDLAQAITEDEKIEKSIKSLIEKNLFVRQLDRRKTTFLFHSLFQEALLKKAHATISSEIKHEIFCKIGNYYVGLGEYVHAIQYFLKAEEFTIVDEILKQVGMGLLAINQTTTLAAILKQIPQDIVRNSAWLCLYSGILGLNKDPADSYAYYETAKHEFYAQGDERGEMIVLAQLIHFHLYADGQHNLGRPHLFRLEELFLKNQENFEDIALMRFAHAIAGGYCFFEFDAEKIDFYSKMAFDTAQHLDLPNYLATARIVNCYRYSFVGNWHRFQQEMELSLPLLANQRVSLEHKLGLTIAQISVLIMQGDFSNYRRKKEWLLASVGKNIMSLSVIAPFLVIYDANILIAEKKYKEAKNVIEVGLQKKGASSIPHQRSQMLHFLALLEAINGNTRAAIVAAEKSRELRLEVGPGRFDALNQLILGITYLLIDDFITAEKFFDAALETVSDMHDEHLIASVRFNRAYLFIKTDRQDAAKVKLSSALIQMKQYQYVYFFGWVPKIMEALLQFAVNWDIEAEHAKKLAKNRLGLSLQQSIPPLPILKIKVTGSFTLSLGEKQIAHETDFSPIQRQCLANLLASPGHCLSQERLQASLWPESPEAKARSNFDTMLSRLRKVLTPMVAPSPVKSYLSLQKGLLRLENIETDILQFQKFSQSALKNGQKSKFWQTENHLHLAMEHWGGKPLPNLPANELVDAARFGLENLYIKSVNLWSKILAKHGQIQHAVELLNQALLLNPTEHDLVQNLYCLNVQTGSSVQAAKVIQNYRDSLQLEEYLPVEIDEILESLWDAA